MVSNRGYVEKLPPSHNLNGNFSEESRQFEILRWLEKLTRTLDSGNWEAFEKFLAKDYQAQIVNGTTLGTGEESLAGHKRRYATCDSWYNQMHCVQFSAVPGGFIAYGTVLTYHNFKGSKNEEKPCTSDDGRKWDFMTLSILIWEVERSEGSVDGLALKKTATFGDTAGWKSEAVKRGLLEPSALGL